MELNTNYMTKPNVKSQHRAGQHRNDKTLLQRQILFVYLQSCLNTLWYKIISVASLTQVLTYIYTVCYRIYSECVKINEQCFSNMATHAGPVNFRF